jgi:hypothetical protein
MQQHRGQGPHGEAGHAAQGRGRGAQLCGAGAGRGGHGGSRRPPRRPPARPPARPRPAPTAPPRALQENLVQGFTHKVPKAVVAAVELVHKALWWVLRPRRTAAATAAAAPLAGRPPTLARPARPAAHMAQGRSRWRRCSSLWGRCSSPRTPRSGTWPSRSWWVCRAGAPPAAPRAVAAVHPAGPLAGAAPARQAQRKGAGQLHAAAPTQTACPQAAGGPPPPGAQLAQGRRAPPPAPPRRPAGGAVQVAGRAQRARLAV